MQALGDEKGAGPGLKKNTSGKKLIRASVRNVPAPRRDRRVQERYQPREGEAALTSKEKLYIGEKEPSDGVNQQHHGVREKIALSRREEGNGPATQVAGKSSVLRKKAFKKGSGVPIRWSRAPKGGSRRGGGHTCSWKKISDGEKKTLRANPVQCSSRGENGTTSRKSRTRRKGKGFRGGGLGRTILCSNAHVSWVRRSGGGLSAEKKMEKRYLYGRVPPKVRSEKDLGKKKKEVSIG